MAPILMRQLAYFLSESKSGLPTPYTLAPTSFHPEDNSVAEMGRHRMR